MSGASDIPIVKAQSFPIAQIIPQTGGVPTSGSVAFQFTVPSARIHFTVEVTNTPKAQAPSAGSLWTVTPLSGKGAGVTEGPPQPGDLQPVINAGPLPDAYEGETGVRLWRVDCNLVCPASELVTPSAQWWATVTWQQAIAAVMTDEQRRFLFGHCAVSLLGAAITLGTGSP